MASNKSQKEDDMSDSARIVLHAYDGARQAFPNAKEWSAKTIDGRQTVAGKQILDFDLKGPVAALAVPFFDNFGDLYSVVAAAEGFADSGWYPVHVTDKADVLLHLMFLPRNGAFNFSRASWSNLQQARPTIARIIARGGGGAVAGTNYGDVLDSRQPALACYLNCMTALAEIRLPSGKSPLDYYWNIGWPSGVTSDGGWFDRLDRIFQPDRFFCYVERSLLTDLQSAVGHGFSREPNPGAWGHEGATESYKQTQFDVGNVQLTFYGKDLATFVNDNGQSVPCIKVEPDMDYYKDVATHGLLEVVPNWITQGRTDPRSVYALRWMAAKREGLLDFDPLFVIS